MKYVKVNILERNFVLITGIVNFTSPLSIEFSFSYSLIYDFQFLVFYDARIPK